MNTMLSHALKYRRAGWSIIPVNPADRKPYIKWMVYQKVRATKQEIREWWKAWPEASIGIVTGKISGIVVVDVDPRHGGDISILEEYPTNMYSKTGGGGYHLFYKYPAKAKDVPCRVGLWDGIDIRADGGFIVAPPSVHKSGKSYEWLKHNEMAPLDGELLDIIRHGTPAVSDDATTSTEHWITNLLSTGVVDGRRNDSLAKLAGFYASKDIPYDIALTMIHEWATSKLDGYGRDFDYKELQTTVKSVYKTKKRRDINYRKVDTHKPPSDNIDLLKMVTLPQYICQYADANVEWTIEDWLPSGTIGFIVAPPGSYKTWLSMDLAVSVATGTDFLGMYKTAKKGPVLVFQQEDHRGNLAQRLGVIVQDRFNTGARFKNNQLVVQMAPDVPVYLHPDRHLRFDDPVVMDMLEYHIATIKPRLIICDPLYTCTSTDEYMVKAAEHMQRLKQLRDTYGCSFIVLHHTTKKAKNERGQQQANPVEDTDREGLWGSQFLNALLETGWQVRVKDNKSIIVRRHFKDSPNKDSIVISFDINTDPKKGKNKYNVTASTIADMLPDNQIKLDKSGQLIYDLLSSPMAIADIAARTGFHRSKVTRKLQSLMENNWIAKDGLVYYAL